MAKLIIVVFFLFLFLFFFLFQFFICFFFYFIFTLLYSHSFVFIFVLFFLSFFLCRCRHLHTPPTHTIQHNTGRRECGEGATVMGCVMIREDSMWEQQRGKRGREWENSPWRKEVDSVGGSWEGRLRDPPPPPSLSPGLRWLRDVTYIWLWMDDFKMVLWSESDGTHDWPDRERQ